MRVHVVKLGVLSAFVAAVLVQAASSHTLASAVPASDQLPSPLATLSLATATPELAADRADLRTDVEVPGAWSFDDAHGGVWVGGQAAAPTSDLARRPVALRKAPKPPKPPTRARTGAMPAAGTPQAVLAAAYVKAAAKAPTSCHLEPAHLAAIGQVESGSIGGRRVGADHRVTPGIYGPLLDGGPFAVVRDTDGGAVDGAGDFDRAVGPLQFIPGTWRWAGRDGDGDGRKDPQNVYDATLATADYLCRDGRDLSRAGDLRAAIRTYNWSGEYVAAVTQWATFFTRHGLAAMDDVAFRVGSGGRASDLAVPDDAKAKKEKEKKEKAAKAKAAKAKKDRAAKEKRDRDAAKGKDTKGGNGGGTPDRPTTPTGPSSGTPTPTPTTSTPAPTTPAPTTPAPTTPAPTTTTPPPTTPAPSPTTTPPAPATTAPAATNPSAATAPGAPSGG